MNLDVDFAFSQSRLGDYADCPRRFELRHILRLRYPALDVEEALEFERRARQGDRFHQLVQQHILGLPAPLLSRTLESEPELARWWANYLALPELPPHRHAEISLQTSLEGHRLLAKYDLIALEPGGPAQIIDWKTGARVPRRPSLARRMQTIVYRYVLAQAGAHLYGEPIPPERIQMDYVYISAGQRHSFAYSSAQMAKDEALLARMIRAIQTASAFPLTEDERRCRFCNYRALCDRGGAGRLEDFDLDAEVEDEESFELDFDQVAEIAF